MANRALSLALLITMGLAACGDASGDYPALMPTDQLLAEPAIPGHAQIAASSPDQVAADLEAAGAGLAVSSAEVVAAETAGDADLARRAEALRKRAAALEAQSVCAEPDQGTDCR